jgi:hypothetical protein
MSADPSPTRCSNRYSLKKSAKNIWKFIVEITAGARVVPFVAFFFGIKKNENSNFLLL